MQCAQSGVRTLLCGTVPNELGRYAFGNVQHRRVACALHAVMTWVTPSGTGTQCSPFTGLCGTGSLACEFFLYDLHKHIERLRAYKGSAIDEKCWRVYQIQILTFQYFYL